MKTIRLADLPCPETLDGPYPMAWFVRREDMVALGNSKGDSIPLVLRYSAVPFTHIDDLRGLIGIARSVGAKRVFEIGTFNGATAVQLHRAGFHVESLDLPPGQEGTFYDLNDEWIALPNSKNGFYAKNPPHPITLHYCDSMYFYPGALAATFDLVFVDGYHSADYVASDSRLAMKLLRPGGTIVWDDFHLDERVAAPAKAFVEGRGGELVSVPEIDMAFWTEPCRAT